MTFNSGQTYVLLLLVMFIFIYLFCHRISELPRPIAVKLCHIIDIWALASSKIRGPSPQKMGPKTCQIWIDFAELQTSDFDRNISGTSQETY